MEKNCLPCQSIALSLLLLSALLTGCAEWVPPVTYPYPYPYEFSEETEVVASPPTPKQAAPSHAFYLNGDDSIVGRLATVPVQEGDALLDIARHFGLGYQSIVDANPNLDTWVPREGETVLLPSQFILPEAPRKGIVINLAAMRLFYFIEGAKPSLSTWPIGIGREGRATPLGIMTVDRKTQHPTWYVPESIRRTHAQQGDPLPAIVPPGPDNPLGDYALYLSKPSYLIHGTNKPFSIGWRASNGCIRLYPEDIERVFKEVPTKTPVLVVNQPYLLGWLGGTLYLEAHEPFEEIDPKQAKDNLWAKLKLIEKKQPRPLDWPKIESILKKPMGIPVPIFVKTESLKQRIAEAAALEHPQQLQGQPPKAEIPKSGWRVVTVETEDGFKSQRLAAQLNHLGPRVPAQAVVRNRRYHVIAGPFPDEPAARKVQGILSEDFDTQSELVKPLNSVLHKQAPPVLIRKAPDSL